MVEKCLASCQGLVNSNHQFTLKLSLGKDNFDFQNKELVKSSCKRKKEVTKPVEKRTETAGFGLKTCLKCLLSPIITSCAK